MAPKVSKGKEVVSSSHGFKRSRRVNEEQNEDERYGVRRDQNEAEKAISSFKAYIMTHSQAKARGPTTTDPLWPIVEPRLKVQLQQLYYIPKLSQGSGPSHSSYSMNHSRAKARDLVTTVTR
ncbi:hypothetical protein HAX54_029063 [Datura stramonium]|uniref:Uncharacterized protein n=1 Tax=Datura stramonium TaxID=4076 RepID=A0ABS8V6H7_DATST|nr:hypothetical protein [Datura stramonium]